jgi:hypothetical protein
MRTQAEKGRAFRALHDRERAFIIPNPWDVGTARLLVHLGFEALATTSAGYAFSIGRRDYKVGRDEMIHHVGAIASAVDLPVSADLENCYGDHSETVAETIRLAAAAGLVGWAGGELSVGTARPQGHHPAPSSLSRRRSRCPFCPQVSQRGRTAANYQELNAMLEA